MKDDKGNIYNQPDPNVFEVLLGLLVIAGIAYGLYRLLSASGSTGSAIEQAASKTMKATLSTADIAELLKR